MDRNCVPIVTGEQWITDWYGR